MYMGRKWTNITFKLNDPNKKIEEASSRPRTREEALYDYTKENWDEDNIAPHHYITVTFGAVGRNENKLEKYLNKYFSKFNWIDKAAVIYVTDSANIGYGMVYENKNGEANLLDEYSGYEGAYGSDVAGMISDNYNIYPTEEFYW